LILAVVVLVVAVAVAGTLVLGQDSGPPKRMPRSFRRSSTIS
jgi:hypothetical protein